MVTLDDECLVEITLAARRQFEILQRQVADAAQRPIGSVHRNRLFLIERQGVKPPRVIESRADQRIRHLVADDGKKADAFTGGAQLFGDRRQRFFARTGKIRPQIDKRNISGTSVVDPGRIPGIRIGA